MQIATLTAKLDKVQGDIAVLSTNTAKSFADIVKAKRTQQAGATPTAPPAPPAPTNALLQQHLDARLAGYTRELRIRHQDPKVMIRHVEQYLLDERTGKTMEGITWVQHGRSEQGITVYTRDERHR